MCQRISSINYYSGLPCTRSNLSDSFSLRNNFASQTLRKSGKSRVVSEFSAISVRLALSRWNSSHKHFLTLKMRDTFHPYGLSVYLQIINKISRAITFMASCALHPYMRRRVFILRLTVNWKIYCSLRRLIHHYLKQLSFQSHWLTHHSQNDFQKRRDLVRCHENLNLWNYGLDRDIQKEQEENCLFANNHLVRANWLWDTRNVMLQ